jgi:hypothetical protein
MKTAAVKPAVSAGMASRLSADELAMMKAMLARRANANAATPPGPANSDAVSPKGPSVTGTAPGKNRKAAVATADPGQAEAVPMRMSAKEPDNDVPLSGNIDVTTMNTSFNAAAGDEKGVFPVAVALSRKIMGKDQRIVISGDGDFISNAELSLANKRGENRYYTYGMFRWLSNGLFPVDVSRPEALDTDLKISSQQISGLTLLCKWIIPAIIAVLGAITLLKRRRK